jgi:hypothetical protein
MSYKKGYNYDNVKEFCEKYDCKLLDTREEIDLKPPEINIESSCGHNSVTSFNKLMKDRFGIYCNNCSKDMDEVKCFGCGKMFEFNPKSFLYCSGKCTHSRKATDEQKRKVKETIYKNYGYYDKNGNILDSDEVNKLRLKREAQKRRDVGIEERKVFTYEITKEEYEKEGCELLTTKEEFDKAKLESKRVFKIKGKCGCIIDNSRFDTFLYRKANIICHNCTNINMSVKTKRDSKIDGMFEATIIEKRGVDLIKEKCKDKFIVIKTREACEADILVKPIDEKEDIWLPIQLKVTSKKYVKTGSNQYSFNIRKQYKDMLLLLICIEDKKFWLFESNDKNIMSTSKITIGNNKSRHNNAIINDLNLKFIYWYEKNIYNVTFEVGNTPQNKTSQLEYEYVKLRKNNINFINFITNEMDGLVFDFKIDHLKIQEKVCTPHRKTHFASIRKQGGIKHNGNKKTQTHIPYCESDNDFYWFNLQDRNTFYVVPEIELIDRGFISTKDSTGKTTIGIGSNEHWLNSYKFQYDTINEEDNKEELMLIIHG